MSKEQVDKHIKEIGNCTNQKDLAGLILESGRLMAKADPALADWISQAIEGKSMELSQ